jgi:hypothetical protein
MATEGKERRGGTIPRPEHLKPEITPHPQGTPSSSQQALLQWLREGLEIGRLKLAAIQDDDGQILSVSVILDDGGGPVQPGKAINDPRHTRPL